MKLVVDVISDVQCPWCWVGKRAIETAAANVGVELELHWHPFQLNPSAPAVGAPGTLYEHLVRIVGRREVVDSWVSNPAAIPMNQSVAQSKLKNIHFTISKEAAMYNTYAAHTLLTYAAMNKGYAVQGALKETMLRMAHGEAKNMGEMGNLVTAATEAGLVSGGEEEVRKILDDGATKARLDDELGKARGAKNFNGVPYFTFPDGTHFSGGQPVEQFEKVIRANLK